MALSSCEAEYVSLAWSAQEAVCLQGLLTFFCLMTMDTPVLLCGDNQGALALASNLVAHKRAKHIETRHHFVRQLVEDKRIQLSYGSTKNNLADIFTKNLPKPAFKELSSQLFVIQPTHSSTQPFPPSQLNYFTFPFIVFMLSLGLRGLSASLLLMDRALSTAVLTRQMVKHSGSPSSKNNSPRRISLNGVLEIDERRGTIECQPLQTIPD